MHKLYLLSLMILSTLTMYAQSDPAYVVQRLSECQRNAIAYTGDSEKGLMIPGISVDVLSEFYACAKFGEALQQTEWPKGSSKPEFLSALWKAIAIGEQGRIEHLQWTISRIHDYCDELRPTLRSPQSK